PGVDPQVVPVKGSDPATRGADSFAQQTQAMQDVAFQKLHQESLRARREALERSQAGGKDAMEKAVAVLEAFKSHGGESNLESDRATLLRRPIDSEIQKYKTLKSQGEWASLIKEKNDKVYQDEMRRVLKTENTRQEVTKLMDQYKSLLKECKYDDAVMFA